LTALTAFSLFLTLGELGDPASRDLTPRFLWLRSRSDEELDGEAREVRGKLIAAFGPAEES
jgi:hypothetical protein